MGHRFEGKTFVLLGMTNLYVKRYIDKCFTTCYDTDVKGVLFVAQTMVNFRMDEELKSNMERVCKEMGLSMTTAFTMFAVKVSKEKRIPFEVSVDPFFSETNIGRLQKAIADVNSGKSTLTAHELIEVDDD